MAAVTTPLLLSSVILACLACSEASAPRVTAPNVVTIHGTNFSFSGPSAIPAGMTTFQFVNDGPGLHQAQLVRLDSGETLADLTAALALPGPTPPWLVYVGGPNAVDSARTGNATFDIRPGMYALLCVVNVPGGVPHYMRGMLLPLTVGAPVSAGSTAPPPTPDVTVTLKDYTFTLSKVLTAGSRTFKVLNTDEEPHELEIIRLAPGKTVADMLAWLSRPSGPPPRQALGGVAIIAPAGAPVYFTATLEAGNYALFCFVRDPVDGKLHFMKGMVLPITIN